MIVRVWDKVWLDPSEVLTVRVPTTPRYNDFYIEILFKQGNVLDLPSEALDSFPHIVAAINGFCSYDTELENVCVQHGRKSRYPESMGINRNCMFAEGAKFKSVAYERE